MEELPRYFPFFENWYELAEGRDTDEKRLAFYDTIMRFAFEGKAPEKPVKGASRGVDWAAWDAYNTVRTVLQTRITKAAAGRLGGQAGRGVSRNTGNQNASKTIAKNNSKNNSKTKAETIAINKNINRNRNINTLSKESEGAADAAPRALDPVSGDDFLTDTANPPPKCVPSPEEQRDMARQINVPLDYLPVFMAEISRGGYGYVNRGGVFVALNRRNFKAILTAYYGQHMRNKAKERGDATVGVKLEADDEWIRDFEKRTTNYEDKAIN